MGSEAVGQPGVVMRYASGRGLGIADARELRLCAEDGELRVRRPGAPERVVTTVASARKAVWLDPRQTRRILGAWHRRWDLPAFGGSIVVSDAHGPVLAFFVDEFLPWDGSVEERRQRSGAVDLVRALGLVLEGVRDADLPPKRETRRALAESQPGHQRLGLLALAATLVAGLLAFFTWPLHGEPLGVAAGFASLALAAPVAVLLVRCRRTFDRLVSEPPDPGDRVVYRPPVSAIGRTHSHLQLGRREVVVVSAGGFERWVAGPDEGGVSASVRTEGGDLALVDHDGVPVLVLRAGHVAADEESWARFGEACAQVGIVTGDDPIAGSIGVSRPLDLRFDEREPGLRMSEWERGRIGMVVDVLFPLAGAMLLLGAALFQVEDESSWSIPLALGALAWLGVRAWAGLSYRRWRRQVLRDQEVT